jgi:hypothetical protein
MGTTKPRIDDLTPMVSKVDKRLVGISNLLSRCSRLVVIKYVISSKVHYTHLDHIEKSTIRFIWHGKAIEQNTKSGNCLVQWDKICLSNEFGGLGMFNFFAGEKGLY